MALKCNDHSRALDIFQQAISNRQCANKVLYLHYINLARSNASTSHLVKSIFQKALSHLTEISGDKTNEQFNDLQDICVYYLQFLEEEAQDSDQLQELARLRHSLQEQGFLNSGRTIFSHFNMDAGVGRKRHATSSVS